MFLLIRLFPSNVVCKSELTISASFSEIDGSSNAALNCTMCFWSPT